MVVKAEVGEQGAHKNSVVRRKGRVRSSQRWALHHWFSSRGRSRQLCTHWANMWFTMVSLVGLTTSASSRSLPPAACTLHHSQHAVARALGSGVTDSRQCLQGRLHTRQPVRTSRLRPLHAVCARRAVQGYLW